MKVETRKDKGQHIVEKEKDDPIRGGTLRILLGGVFLTSFSLLSFEMTLTRLLSVMLSYHYVFLVISLALLGLGVGGIFIHFFRMQIPIGHARFGSLSLFASIFSVAIPLSALLIIQIGHIEGIRDNILIYCFPLFIPFFFAGVLLADAFRMFSGVSALIYGVDLIGAAAGSIGFILIIDALTALATIFFLGNLAATAALLFSTKALNKNIRALIISTGSFLVTSVLLGTNLTGFFMPKIPIGADPKKSIHDALYRSVSSGKIIKTKWSAFGRTDLVAFSDHPDQMWIYVDGTAGTPMYRFSGDYNDPGSIVDSLKTEFSGYFPFLFLAENERDNALIIGPGGGRDILLARMGGVRNVTAVEVNKDLVDMVYEYSWYNGDIYADPDNVRIVVDEGRNFLKRQEGRYDLIMLSLAVTESSRSPEAYALTENFLFTTDSVSDYLDHLTDEGRLVVVTHNEVEMFRLLSLSLAVLKERGVGNATAMRHFYMVGSGMNPVFVLKKTPFEPRPSFLEEASIQQLGYDLIIYYFPYTGKVGTVSYDDLKKMGNELGYDISAVTDDSPFFYKFEPGLPQSVSQVLWSSVGLMVLVVLVPPLYRRKRFFQKSVRSEDKIRFNRNLFKSVLLFSMLGMGFMLIEISLIQRFVLFLGRPVLSLAVLLFSLLVGAGAGSIYSNRLSAERISRGIAITSLSIVPVLLMYTLLFPLIFKNLLGLNLTIRMLATTGMLTPLGFLMGFPFPLGIRFLREIKMTEYIPWMWGINGVSSVLGSVVTIIIAINFGFTEALLLGAGCYFTVFLLFN